jgi:Brp/Blh family beta-carotene 15,15'-monooxygenase
METIATPSLKRELIVFFTGCFLWVFYLIIPDWAEKFSLVFLIAGLFFLGIPHGALDNYLTVSPLNTMYKKSIFYISYLTIMAAVMGLWMASPEAGLAFFLLISIWHFGETDNVYFGILNPVLNWITGSLMLAYLLLSHSAETSVYFSLLGIDSSIVPVSYARPLSLLCFLILAVMLWRKARVAGLALVLYLFILWLTSKIPLIPGFGLYFIGVHSYSGWMSIRNGLQFSHGEMMRKAAPYTILAILFILGFIWLQPLNTYELSQVTAWFFIALSCISTPHILLMHYFYRHTLTSAH